MTKLTNMKRTKKDMDKTTEVCAPNSLGDDYPYGLRLSLDNEDLKKLGITLPKNGSTMTLEAVCEVIETSLISRDDKDEQRMSLQIQKLALTKGGGSMEDAIDEGIREASE